MPRIFASFLMLALSNSATADCLPALEGWIELRGEVAACKRVKAPRPSREPFFRIELLRPTAQLHGCDDDACLAEAIYLQYAGFLEGLSVFFVPASSGATCEALIGQAKLVAKVSHQCCDTIPHRGKCALGGPILEPVTNEF